MSSVPLPAQLWRPPGGIHQLLAESALARPDALFLQGLESSYSYQEALFGAARLASWLRDQGVRRGDRVAIFTKNRPELALALFASSMAGATYVVLNAALRPAGVSKILDQCEPAALIGDGAAAEVIAAQRPSAARLLFPEPSGTPAPSEWTVWDEAMACPPCEDPWPALSVDPACLVFTSGSTGTPRGVTLTHANIRFVTGAIQDRLHYREDDVIGCFLPLSFDYGLYQIFLAAAAGATLYVGDPTQVGPRLPKILSDAAVSVLPGVPAIDAALIRLHERRPFELPRLRAITNTGERLPPAYIRKLQAMFPGLSVYVMFGLTECKRVSIMLPSELAAKGDSVGRPLAGTEVYAVDPEGNRLGPGETGELVVRGPHVALGYWRAPQETAVRFRKRAPESSVELFTGDTGSVDADGFVYFASRSDDLIKHRGNRISPVEIENETCAVPGVIEAAVFKKAADDTLHLFVTLSSDALTPESILASLAARLEPAKVPDRVHIEPELPKSINGKIDRKTLQQRLLESA